MSQTTVPGDMARGFAGMLADLKPNEVNSMVSAEASAEIPFGVMAAQGNADDKAILPVDANSVFVGPIVHSHAYDKFSELGTVGVKPKMPLSIMRKGVMYVVTEQAVTKGAAAFVRHTAGVGEQKGAFRTDADTADAVECLGVIFAETTTAAGFALVEVDMANYDADRNE